jgi:hypothetical protein
MALVDTSVGVGVGVAAACIGANAVRRSKLIGQDNLPDQDAGERA